MWRQRAVAVQDHLLDRSVALHGGEQLSDKAGRLINSRSVARPSPNHNIYKTIILIPRSASDELIVLLLRLFARAGAISSAMCT
jgi:hypothetical protein